MKVDIIRDFARAVSMIVVSRAKDKSRRINSFGVSQKQKKYKRKEMKEINTDKSDLVSIATILKTISLVVFCIHTTASRFRNLMITT